MLHKKVDVTVVLSEIRKFKVHILGEVKEPGGYIVNGATRVSDLVISASGLKQKKVEAKTLKTNENDLDSISKLRAVEVDNEDRPRRLADLALFYNYNCIDKNYYLNEGDRVFVPKNRDIVGVYGSVNYPGRYAYYNSESCRRTFKRGGFFQNNFKSFYQ